MPTQRHMGHPHDAVKDVAHAFARVNAAALRSLYRQEVAEEYGVWAVAVKSAVALVTATADRDLNRVVNLGVFEPATQAQVGAVLELYARAHVPFTVQLSPMARPPKLGDWLGDRGLRVAEEWTILSRNLPARVSDVPGVDVVQVQPEDASKYARVFESAFGIGFGQGQLAASAIGQPGWHHYLARDDSRPFAVAAMFVHERTALFAGSGTLRTETGRGAQRALIARRLKDAAALGCDLALVETAESLGGETPPSLHNILHAEFRVAFRQRSFVFDQGFPQRLDLANGRWR
jgi:hypothetical protein